MQLKTSIVILIATTGPVFAADPEPAKPEVASVMRSNMQSLLNLQQYVASPAQFQAPENREEIQKNLDAMTGLKHVFPAKMAEQEPGLVAISSLFSEYLKDVQASFKSGATGNFTRERIRAMTGFCLSCHTRVGTDKTFEDVTKRIESAPLTQLEKAEFYAATRQWDKALKAFEEVAAKTPDGEMGLMDFSRSVRYMLSVSVRAKRDPQATLSVLDALAARKDIPEFFERYVKQWRTDVASWAKELKAAADATDSGLMTKARAMMKRGADAQIFPADPAGDINYLRATNYLHEALAKNPKTAFRGEALYMLGSAYDALQDPLLWALDELYFEACVREFPHSAISQKCYRRYAAKTYFGYSGSGGTFIPADELKKLRDLRKLAE
jgi:tetratricopeptide (TPR) repeat protein